MALARRCVDFLKDKPFISFPLLIKNFYRQEFPNMRERVPKADILQPFD